jgi:hypothetical protein
MDADRFDTLARSLTRGGSRRHALTGLVAGALSGLLFGAFGLLSPSADDAAAHDLKVTCKKKSGKAKKTCLKKAKKHAAAHASETLPPPPPPPPPGGCPSGQKPCDGGCIPSAQCCNTADCRVSGQVCTAARQCACPPALPVACGGACLAPCSDSQERRPNCQCCTINKLPDGANNFNCCSLRSSGGYCEGRPAGVSCEFGEECASYNCVQGSCSPCSPELDYCNYSSDDCGAGGACLRATDGTTRCGIPLAQCSPCSHVDECDQGQRPGYFCAVNTGTNCPCSAGETFCARPA